MSVGRDVISDVMGVSEDDISCKNCNAITKSRIAYICKFWNQTTNIDDFCSFFSKRSNNEKEDYIYEM